MSKSCSMPRAINLIPSTPSLPVPLVYVGDREITLADGGSLADVAPTILALMGLAQPTEMTGRSLIAY